MNLYVVAVLLLGFLLRFGMIHIDPFLQTWDEHFHALVGKNLLVNLSKPVLLQNPFLPYDFHDWSSNHIWVHKQPFFLLQIAGSIKLFGNTVFAVRFPSLVLATLTILLTYRIAYLITKNDWIALIALVIATFSNFQFNLISARIPTDHNDIAFGFYILASIWAYFEFLRTGQWYWALLAGFFSGIAILVKWLVGLLVFSAWGPHSVYQFWKERKTRTILYLLFSVLTCMLVFLPWQLFAYYHYSKEYLYESWFNRQHLYYALEGHGGTILYYAKNFKNYFGYVGSLLCLGGIFIGYRNGSLNTVVGKSTIFYFFLPLAFFSLVATKMNNFMYPVLALGFIFISIAVHFIRAQFIRKSALQWLFLAVLLLDISKPFDIYARTYKNEQRKVKKYNATVLKNIDALVPVGYDLVFNLKNDENIDLMFYSNRGLTAYRDSLSPTQISFLSKQKIPIAAFTYVGNDSLPPYLRDYSNLYLIPVKLKY